MGLPSLLVCEDDAWFRFDADRLLERVVPELPSDWDILHLYSPANPLLEQPWDERHNLILQRREPYSEHLERGFIEVATTIAYAVRPRAAARLLEVSMPLLHVADHYTGTFGVDEPDETLDHGFNTFVARPYPCRAKGPSTILDRPWTKMRVRGIG
jgi:GR25 family glycosyltransferase involved in LPS biosynthesis